MGWVQHTRWKTISLEVSIQAGMFWFQKGKAKLLNTFCFDFLWKIDIQQNDKYWLNFKCLFLMFLLHAAHGSTCTRRCTPYNYRFNLYARSNYDLSDPNCSGADPNFRCLLWTWPQLFCQNIVLKSHYYRSEWEHNHEVVFLSQFFRKGIL